MDIEKIERYLNGQMEPSEEESFESQMKKWPSLEDDVRTMAYIIHSIKDVAIEKENERIDRIKLSTHTDRKRYITAVAALFLAIAMVTGSIATGLYFLLKDKEEGTKQTTQSEFKAPTKIEGNPIQLPKAQQEEKKEGKKKEETNKETKNEEKEAKQAVETIQKGQTIQFEEQKDRTQRSTVEEEPSHKEQTKEEIDPSSVIKSRTDANKTSYSITNVASEGETIIITMILKNNDDSNMLKFSDAKIIDSRNNRTSVGNIYANGKYSSETIIRPGQPITLKFYFYNIKGQPSYLQWFGFQESNSHSKLEFRNLRIR